jgi:hypothetical protein
MRIQVVSPRRESAKRMHFYSLPYEIEYRLLEELKRHKKDPTLRDPLNIILRGTEYENWQIISIDNIDKIIKNVGLTLDEFFAIP